MKELVVILLVVIVKMVLWVIFCIKRAGCCCQRQDMSRQCTIITVEPSSKKCGKPTVSWDDLDNQDPQKLASYVALRAITPKTRRAKRPRWTPVCPVASDKRTEEII